MNLSEDTVIETNVRIATKMASGVARHPFIVVQFSTQLWYAQGMELREISKEEYAQLYVGSGFSFLQSPQWGELKRIDGYVPRYFRIDDSGATVGAFMALCKSYPILGLQAYIPRPLFFFDKQCDFLSCGACMKDATAILRKMFGVVLIDLDSNGRKEQIEEAATSSGFELSDKTIQPHKTAMIELSQEEEEWLASCRKSAKERIKAGMKADAAGRIKVTRISLPENGKEIDEVISKVVALSEEKFSARKGGYLKRLIEVFGDLSVVWRVSVGDRCVGGSIGILSEQQKIYHSIYSVIEREALHELNAGYLVKLYQWRLGHELGYKWLDMWGVETDPNHPWYGFSQFKLGFGAKIVEYPGQLRLFRNSLFRASFKLKSR